MQLPINRLVNVIAVTSLLFASVMGEMSQADKDYILKVHNDYRAGEGASNMPKLEWDSALEQEARAWAKNCQFKHKGMGENLAWNSAITKPQEYLIGKAMKAFFDEKNLYSYGRDSCAPASCHYTQLVWSETTKVGCATHVCTPLHNAYKEAWFLVCRYDPPGNWAGEKPYLKGAACSKCSAGSCQGGLCVGSTLKRAAEGTSVDLQKKDCTGVTDADDCDARYKAGECANGGSDYAQKNCRLLCDLC